MIFVATLALLHLFSCACPGPYAYSSVSTRQRLQRVQNCAARLVADAPRRTSSHPLLHQLHWLPVEARIMYKLCTLMYRIFNGTAPQYLAELCQLCSDDIDCDPRRIRTTLYHEHTNVWLTVHFLLRDLLHGTLYWSNFVTHPLTARFVAVLKHFYFLSFIPSDIVFYSLHFSLAYFYCSAPLNVGWGGGRHSKWLIDWLNENG